MPYHLHYLSLHFLVWRHSWCLSCCIHLNRVMDKVPVVFLIDWWYSCKSCSCTKVIPCVLLSLSRRECLDLGQCSAGKTGEFCRGFSCLGALWGGKAMMIWAEAAVIVPFSSNHLNVCSLANKMEELLLHSSRNPDINPSARRPHADAPRGALHFHFSFSKKTAAFREDWGRWCLPSSTSTL